MVNGTPASRPEVEPSPSRGAVATPQSAKARAARGRSAPPGGPPAGPPGASPAAIPARISAARYDSLYVAPAFSTGGSRFATEYARGTLPCHIDHGTCSNRLAWELEPEELVSRRDGLIVLCAEGLSETRHPYATLSRLAFADLASLDGAPPLDDEALRRTMAALRLALLAEPQVAASPVATRPGQRPADVFQGALLALKQLAKAEGPQLAPLLQMVLPPVGKRMHQRAYREPVQELIRDLNRYGGPEVAKVLRSRGFVASA